MLSGKRSFVVLGLALLALAASFTYISTRASAQGQGKKKTIVIPSTGKAPTLALAAQPTYLTACAGSGSASGSQVQLHANAASTNGAGLSYTWTIYGKGSIVSDLHGPNPVWDLSNLPPGTYQVRVDVDTGNGDQGCSAFSTTTVTVAPCPPVNCPSIILSCPDSAPVNGPVTFTANISGIPGGITPTYNWSVSGGTISSGQGTRTIQVDTTGLAGQAIRATLEVSGFPLSCSATCTVQVPVLPLYPSKFDEFPNIKFDDEKARLDNYAIQLQSDPRAQGYIIVYPSPRDRPGDSQKRADRARGYLVNTRGIDANRIFILTGGQRPAQTIELWLVPNGATPPTPTP
jgi:hypothetical protein